MSLNAVKFALLGTIQQMKLCDFKACGPRQTYRLLSHCPVDLPSHEQKSAENGAGKVSGAGQNLRVSHQPGKMNVSFSKDIQISPIQLHAVPGWDLLSPWVCTNFHHSLGSWALLQDLCHLPLLPQEGLARYFPWMLFWDPRAGNS